MGLPGWVLKGRQPAEIDRDIADWWRHGTPGWVLKGQQPAGD
jgi:hypothetical protein